MRMNRETTDRPSGGSTFESTEVAFLIQKQREEGNRQVLTFDKSLLEFEYQLRGCLPAVQVAAGGTCTDCYWLTPAIHMSCCAHLHRSSPSASFTKHSSFQVETNIAGSFAKLGEEPCNYSLVFAHFDGRDIETDQRIRRCNSCRTTYLEDGDQVIIPVDGEYVHEAYEGLEDDDLNNSKQELLHDDTGWHEKFTSVVSLVEQGVNGPTSTNRSFGTNCSHNQTLNYQDKKLEAADCSKRRAALYHSARAASSSAHTDNTQSHRDPRTRAISTVPCKKRRSPVLGRNVHLSCPGETGIFPCFNASVRTLQEENNGLVDFDQVPLPLIRSCSSTYITVSNEHNVRVFTNLHSIEGCPKKSSKEHKLERWRIPGGSMNIFSAGVHPCGNVFFCTGGDDDDGHPCGEGMTCSL